MQDYSALLDGSNIPGDNSARLNEFSAPRFYLAFLVECPLEGH